MTIGQLGMKLPSLAGMVTAINVSMSRVALHYRFTAAAASFLLKCLQFVLKDKFLDRGMINVKLLQPFSRVLIADSSSWDVHENLHSVLPGSGGSASKANCKIQMAYDYKHGELEFTEVTAGNVPDNRYTSHLPDIVQKGDLLLFDQGYSKVKTFSEISAKGAYFLTRFRVNIKLKDCNTKTPISLEKHLNEMKGNACELEVCLSDDPLFQPACRLIALRVSEQIANERRRKLNKAAKKKGRKVSLFHLRMCNWTLLITNAPKEWLPLEMVRALYSARWQIELLFKQLKSVLRIHQSNTRKENRLRCEIYGNLISAVMIHRIHAVETIKLWNSSRREVSFDKLYKRIQERAFTLLFKLIHSVQLAFIYLEKQLKIIMPNCLKGRQKSRMATLEMLDAQIDPKLQLN